MMDEFLYKLNIPSSCKIDRKIFKKQLMENFSLNSSDKKVLSEFVNAISLEYQLNKETINISPFLDDDRDYSEILFIKVDISNINKLNQITSILLNIPSPLVLIVVFKSSISINITPRRINKADSSKLVSTEAISTDWINLESLTDLDNEFIKSLDINNHPFTDLFAFYSSYLNSVVAYNASKYSGVLSSDINTKDVLNDIAVYESSFIELKNKIKKETDFKEKVNLNIELKKTSEKLDNLKGSL